MGHAMHNEAEGRLQRCVYELTAVIALDRLQEYTAYLADVHSPMQMLTIQGVSRAHNAVTVMRKRPQSCGPMLQAERSSV